ncbi:MAG: cytochrome c family protein [Terriglobia bacterium]
MNFIHRLKWDQRTLMRAFIGLLRPAEKVVPMSLVAVLAILAVSPAMMVAQDDAAFFRRNCHSCHTIGGGRLTGPDLKDVTQRKDRAWLERFIPNPKAVIDAGDPYAQQLVQEARGVVMPTVSGVTPDRARTLIDLIEAESKLPKSQFVGLQISDRPFTPQEVAAGWALFRGETRLAGGGAACVSCHTVKGAGGLGGGKIGPDLSRVFERLQGRKGLAAWLAAPATPTMQATFRNKAFQNEEILPLVALFEDRAKSGGDDSGATQLNFLLMGLGGMALMMVAFDAIWKGRFRGVRRALVRGEETR